MASGNSSSNVSSPDTGIYHRRHSCLQNALKNNWEAGQQMQSIIDVAEKILTHPKLQPMNKTRAEAYMSYTSVALGRVKNYYAAAIQEMETYGQLTFEHLLQNPSALKEHTDEGLPASTATVGVPTDTQFLADPLLELVRIIEEFNA